MILGLGGFIAEDSILRSIGDELKAVKVAAGLPADTELKWSPPPGHFLRDNFSGSREDLYRSAISILARSQAEVVCAVHFLNECHGVKLHGWPIQKAAAWASRHQLRYISERFQRPCLSRSNEWGLIVCDEAGARDEDEDRIEEFLVDLERGTPFEHLDRVVMAPIPAKSKFLPHLQFADLVVGIITGSIAGGKHARALFGEIGPLFLRQSLQDTSIISSTLSGTVVGFGLKLFPTQLGNSVQPLFSELDRKYIVTQDGLQRCRE
jgi:hypothetical protein